VTRPTRKSPEWGLSEGAVGVVLVPLVPLPPSVDAIPETSATTIWPATELGRVAVTVWAPPDEPKPTQMSAVPFDACLNPLSDAQVTPPPETPVASKPLPEPAEALVPMRATSASPAPTALGRVTDAEVPENEAWFSWITFGGPEAGPDLSASIVTSNAADGDQPKVALGVDPVPILK
jgi:hypothetical protein